MNSGALQRFSGFHDDYEYWRTHIISTVHLQLVHIGFKIQALIYCLKDSVPEVTAILQTMGTSQEDRYPQVIHFLEVRRPGKDHLHEARCAQEPPARGAGLQRRH